MLTSTNGQHYARKPCTVASQQQSVGHCLQEGGKKNPANGSFLQSMKGISALQYKPHPNSVIHLHTIGWFCLYEGLQGVRSFPTCINIQYVIPWRGGGRSLIERFNSGAIFLMWLQVKATRLLAIKPYGKTIPACPPSVTPLLFSFLYERFFSHPYSNASQITPSTACVLSHLPFV